MNILEQVERNASRLNQIPLISRIAPSVEKIPTQEDLDGFLAAQNLAFKAVREVQSLMKEGWTEVQTARLLETILRDGGVKSFFHRPFVWFGENTRFTNVKRYQDFQSSKRRVHEDEVVILDVAPVLNSYVCDIGYSFCLGKNQEFDKAMAFLQELKNQIPILFNELNSGEDIWQKVDELIKNEGYDNIHDLYPMSVLGHRIHQAPAGAGFIQLLNFEWSSYWNLFSRGLFGQLLSPNYQGGLKGLWAIEPHIGTKSFGVKFEEILVVDENGARWLSDEVKK